MAQFQFKLDAVLKHRRAIEDERQRDLAKLLRQSMILENQLRSMQEHITADKHAMGDALVGRVDVGRVRQHAAHTLHVAARAQQIVLKLRGLHMAMETARQALAQAMSDRKAVEQLRDKAHKQWLEELERQEQMELDDLAGQAFERRRREVGA